jgi:TonB-dependent receptor
LARTTSKFKLRAESVDYNLSTNDYTVNWYTGEVGGSGPTFDVVGIDFSDPAMYEYRGFYERYLVAKGDDWQGRLDAEYEPAGLDWLPKIQGGVRYTNRDASRSDGERYWDAGNDDLNIPISAVPLNYELFHSAFRGDNHKPSPTSWLAPTFGSVWDNLEALRQFNIANGIPLDTDPGRNRSQNNDTNPPAPVPTRAFNINEKTLAAYGQIKFDFRDSSIPVEGLLGMRVVQTKDQINGFSAPTLAAVGQPIEVRSKYTNWLPNLNVNVHLSEQLKLRLAATKTITRPLFEQLNPGLVLGTPPCTDPAIPTCIIAATGGNPFLKPLRSNNYDASLEYYFSPTGFASFAVFRRDMKGFVLNRTFGFPEPDVSTGLPIEVTGPVNTNKARIQGLEAQVSTFFDFGFVPDWARSFGVQANATYVDARAALPVFCPAFLDPCVPTPPFDPNATVLNRERIPDVSKWTFNLVGMYERGPLTLRLSYNHRTSYPEGALSQRREGPGDAPINFTLQGRGRSTGRLDWSSSYAVTDAFTLFFDWTNILNIPFRSDIVRVDYTGGEAVSREVFPMVVRFNESVMTGGVRFRFGGRGSAPAAAPAPDLPPPPPAVVEEPAPAVEPAPPPPPPPPPTGERG